MQYRQIQLRLLTFIPVFLIPVLVFLIVTEMKAQADLSHQRLLVQLQHSYIKFEKDHIRTKVNNVVEIIVDRHIQQKRDLHNHLQYKAETAISVAETLYQSYKDKLSPLQLQKLIIAALRAQFEKETNSSIWILDQQGVLQLASQSFRSQEGRSFKSYQDAQGKNVVLEEIDLIQNKKHGFLWSQFRRDNEPLSNHYTQLSYVKSLSFYGWYIAVKEFVDLVNKTDDRHLLTVISQLNKDDADYFFALDSDSRMILNAARPDIVGKKILEMDDPQILDVYQQLLKASKDPTIDFVEYNWLNPASGKKESKLTYVLPVLGTGWIVGRGFHPNTLDKQFQAQKKALESRYQQQLEFIQNLRWYGVISGFLVSLFLAVFFYRILQQQYKFCQNESTSLSQQNIDLENQLLETRDNLQKAKLDMEDMALVDSLTQVANRSVVISRIREEQQRAQRFEEAFSVILINVDWLKRFNQEYGYELGDQSLQEISTLIFNHVRSVDLFGRLGNDEFMVVMPNTDITAAEISAERIRVLIEEHVFDSGLKMTVSLGVIQYQKGQNVSELLKAADDALWQAKKLGRNHCYCLH